MCFLFLSADFYFFFNLIFILFWLVLIPGQRWQTSCHISGHSLAFEACFKLPATCTWTQAAKASLGRQRHTYNFQQELLTWGKWKIQCFTPGRRDMELQLVGSIGLMNYTMLCLSERKKV